MENPIIIIIPCYNETSRITLQEFQFAISGYQYDFLLVNDGSTDDTSSLLDSVALSNANCSVLNLQKNSGKAEAIRQAVLQLKKEYQYIGYLDADFATPMAEMHKMKIFADENPYFTIIMGSRIKKLGSNIVRYGYRHYLGRIFATIVSKIILKTAVYDTQCGAKIIDHKLAHSLFKDPFITKWLFDVEFLKRYRQIDPHYTTKVYEYSLNTWIEKGKSKIKLKDLFAFPYQLIKIYFHYEDTK